MLYTVYNSSDKPKVNDMMNITTNNTELTIIRLMDALEATQSSYEGIDRRTLPLVLVSVVDAVEYDTACSRGV